MRASNSEIKFNLEVKFFYFYRFMMSYAVKPEYFVRVSKAMDQYAVDYTTRMSIAGAFDHISRGSYANSYKFLSYFIRILISFVYYKIISLGDHQSTHPA